MKFDPGNKYFVTIFAVGILGVIGFLIASIFIDFSGDKEVKKFEFERSQFEIVLKQLKEDKSYVLEVHNGDKHLQNVELGTEFGDREVEIIEISNGWKVQTSESNAIEFTTDVDTEKFASLYVKRKFSNKNAIATDCIKLDPDNLNWYGGPQQLDQRYPVQNFEFTDVSFVTKYTNRSGLMERYWFSSNGFFILIDFSTPLFVDQNTLPDKPNTLCFTAKKALPYYTHDEEFSFQYRIGAGADPKETHLNVVNRILGKPRGMPDERMVRYPIWNSWVRFGRTVNEQNIVDFAEEIIEHGFKYSLLDIDDFWEDCYGSLVVNSTKFGNLKTITDDLKAKGFIIVIWVHPFVNKGCEPYYTFAKDNDFLVKSHSGSTDTRWWNSDVDQAAHIDFTNPAALSWFRQRLELIQENFGIDSFKFDAGETNYYPEDPVLRGDTSLSPNHLVLPYFELANSFGNMIEVRNGWGTQHFDNFIRMLDMDSRWTEFNGLKSLIPTLIQFNLNGYIFVLPDMIGGNAYGDDRVTKELFIRWLQASVFMPSLQFSVVPWEFDEETVEITRKFTRLHEQYSSLIMERFRLGVSDGHPVNPPIWWLNPEDKEAQKVADEYLLGETVLVAPVIEEGKTARDIYLPAGTWKDGNTGEIYNGDAWIRNHPAPLDTLPYFIKHFEEVELKKIEFSQSQFNIQIKHLTGDNSYALEVFNGENHLQTVELGTHFGEEEVEVVSVTNGWKIQTSDNNAIEFTVDQDNDQFASIRVTRTSVRKNTTITDCLNLNPDNVNWYGGPEQMDQRYPIQKFEFTDYAYITKELHSAAIMERYWLSSNGFFILIDYDTPLFIDQNNLIVKPDNLCFTAKKSLPYYTHDETFKFSYRIGAGATPKSTHLNVINRMLGKPTGLPDERLIRYPIWNSWVRYGRPINENIIRDFAEEIIEHGFKYSLLDIDDFWEDCYGSMTVNTTNFGNLNTLTTDLKAKGFIMGMWVHPFVNKNCEPYYTYAKENDFLVKSHSGSTDTSWWNSEANQASHVDFTNPAAFNWYRQRLEFIRENFGIDIFKFDAGETSWYPEDPVLLGDTSISPSQITRSFVELAASFGNLPEIRTGWGTQHLPILVRMLDFDSRWTAQNGLKSLIPTLIQFNLNGYIFVLPDMIGGNAYNDDRMTKELFIRWLQASVFMPSLQFSVVPWQFDAETIEISLKFTQLHESYADLILSLFSDGIAEGIPVNPPIWWLSPEDKEAQVIPDEYLLGERILAAPVIEEGKRERDIYLPVGTWRDGNSAEIHEGPKWIRNYPAPLDVLPYFILQ